jgi:hypothetical protein
METLTIEIREPKGLDLIRDLEALNVLKIIKKDDVKVRLSDMFRGCISAEEGAKLNEYVKQ